MPADLSPDQQQLKALADENLRLTEANKYLSEELSRYRLLVDSASDLIHSVTPEGKFIYTNQAWRDTLGYSDNEISRLSLMEIVDKNCQGQCRVIFDSLIQGEKIDRNTTTFISRDGGKVIVEGRCTTHFENGKPLFMTGIFRDMTLHAIQELALLESEKKYRDLFESSSNLIQLVLPNGRLKYANKAWRDTFGYSEEKIASLSIFDLIAKDCQNHCQTVFQQIISDPKLHHIETTFTTKEGRKILIEGNAICNFENGKPTFTHCIFQDVTEKKSMEKELIKGQKLESLGILAGGIAHDFNNLLTAILGNISLARMYATPGDEVIEYLNKTENASMRAQGLTKQLLTFSKGGAPIKKITSVTDLVKDCSSFVLRGSKVKCDFHFEDGLKAVEADEDQLSQVVQNLVINASQAMPDGGIITIHGHNRIITQELLPPLPAGEYIELLFEDHGIGIAAEDLSRIFEPYFTSKSTGSGLGLAISYSIIKKHGGTINVNSNPGKGTIFSILLPAVQSQNDTVEKSEDLPQITPARVLLMDDDTSIRDIASAMLEIMNCSVKTAQNGNEALRLYAEAIQERSPYDFVIMDLTIPGGMGGKEAISELLALDPDAKVIVSSGYANDPIMANHAAYGFKAILPKPFTFKNFNQIVAKIMEDAPERLSSPTIPISHHAP